MLDTALAGVRERGLQLARARWALPAGLAEAIGLFITLRVSLSLVALMLSSLYQLPSPCFQFGFDDWASKPELAGQGMNFRLLGVWERWDACWYLRIADHGYERGEPSTAFFPLYPALTRAAGELLGGRMVLGGMVISGLAYIAAITGLYRLVQRDFDVSMARRTVLYLSVFPTAFFLFAPFTEALFLATAVWTIYAARMRWWAWAGVAALLAGLTRIQGAVLVLPLAWEAWRAIRDERLVSGIGGRSWFRAIPPGLAVLAPLAGPLLFYLYSSNEIGTSTLEAQRSEWGTSWDAPWNVLRWAWDWSFNQTDLPWRDLQAITAFNIVVLLGFVALLVIGARRLPLSYFLYAAPQLLLISARVNPTPLTSTARYLLVLFPIFVILALLGRNRWADQSWLVLSLLFLGLLTAAFLQNTFIA